MSKIKIPALKKQQRRFLTFVKRDPILKARFLHYAVEQLMAFGLLQEEKQEEDAKIEDFRRNIKKI